MNGFCSYSWVTMFYVSKNINNISFEDFFFAFCMSLLVLASNFKAEGFPQTFGGLWLFFHI